MKRISTISTIPKTLPKLSNLSSIQTLTTLTTSLDSDDPSPPKRHSTDDLAADVEKLYRILRKFHSRPPKLDLALRDSSVPLRPGLVESVLARCGDGGAVGFRFFTWASKQPGYCPSAAIYKSMVKMLGKMRQFGAAWALIDEMRREAPELISPEVFIVLMRRFASSRMVAKAIEMLDEMPKYGCEPNEYVFSCLLDALCKNGAVKEAASLFEDMRERFPPSLKNFTSLLYGWCKAGKLVEAKVALIRMRESGFAPDVVVYNTLLGGFAAAGRIEDGRDLLSEMRRKGCEPNAASHTTLIQALCSKNRLDEAMQVFVEMRRSGCRADIVTYTTLISGFCKAGKIDKAYEFIKTIEEEGCKPTANTFLHILLAHEKKEQLEECLELKLRIAKAGCLPDITTYNTLIRLSCKLGELKQAQVLWGEMEASGLSPGLDTFVIMLHGFVDQGLLIEACQYFKEMVARGLFSAPHYGTLKELLNPLLRAEKLELAKEMWDCIVDRGCELNIYAWTIWIHALFSNKHVKEACVYCLEMMDAGLMPQPDTFAKLMKGLKKLYNRQIAAEITEKVRKMAAERNVTFKMYKRRGVLDKEKKARAMKMKRRGRRGRLASGLDRGPRSHLSIISEDESPPLT